MELRKIEKQIDKDLAKDTRAKCIAVRKLEDISNFGKIKQCIQTLFVRVDKIERDPENTKKSEAGGGTVIIQIINQFIIRTMFEVKVHTEVGVMVIIFQYDQYQATHSDLDVSIAAVNTTK